MENEDGATSVLPKNTSKEGGDVKVVEASPPLPPPDDAPAPRKADPFSPLINASSYMTFDVNSFQSHFARDIREGEVVLRNGLRNAPKTSCVDRIHYPRDATEEANCVEVNNVSKSRHDNDVELSNKSEHSSTEHSGVKIAAIYHPKEMSVKCAAGISTTKKLCVMASPSNGSSNSSITPAMESEAGSVLHDAVQAITKIPFADPEEVKNLLENDGHHRGVFHHQHKHASPKKPSPNHSESSFEELGTESETLASSDDSRKNDESDFIEHSLMIDVLEIVKIFPDKDRYEIYAYLEAHIHKVDRLQIVVDELLSMANSSKESSPRRSPVAVEEEDGTSGSSGSEGECEVQDVVIDSLTSIFPSVDYEVVESILKGYVHQNADRSSAVFNELVEMSSMPKLQQNLRGKLKEMLTKMRVPDHLLISAFLELFDNPEEYYYDESKCVSETYKKHATTSLFELFPELPKQKVEEALIIHRFHYTPALRQLEYEYGSSSTQFKENPKRIKFNADAYFKADEIFSKEYLFTQLEGEILAYKKEREKSRFQRISEAREKNELLTCISCYDENLLADDVAVCTKGHISCKDCIHKEAEQKLSQQLNNICCSNCNSLYKESRLEKILKPSLFSFLLKNKQRSEQAPKAKSLSESKGKNSRQAHPKNYKEVANTVEVHAVVENQLNSIKNKKNKS